MKVLICDDQRHVVRLIAVNFERRGWVVVTAFSGKECLEKIRTEKPDLIVIDLKMPDMDGHQVLETIRGDPETENIYVIMLTAKASNEDVYQGCHKGADMYLTKPFNPREIPIFEAG
jgi:two-component system alkaline phosphatase synthesis response regulator PhoP/two-component system response regulator VicR